MANTPNGLTIKSSFQMGSAQSSVSDNEYASKKIASIVASPFNSSLANYSVDNVGNSERDKPKPLDIVANEIILSSLRKSGKVSVMASEEDDAPVWISDNGPFVVVTDPLDGSRNIDASIPTGTIFGIYNRLAEVDHLPVEEKATINSLQSGGQLVAAGYVLYSSATIMCISFGSGTHAFTLDHATGDFILTHPSIKIPPRGQIYSVNDARYFDWPEGLRKYIDTVRQGKGKYPKKYSARYICSLVADFHRTLLYGGVAMNPRDHLRLVYEANPLIFLVEHAGGRGSDGKHKILSIQPVKLHQRLPLFLGSPEDMEELESYGDVQQKMDLSSGEESDISDSEISRDISISMEQNRAGESLIRLLEEQQRVKEAAQNEILRLERELDEKQRLEMEILELKGKLQVMKHLESEDDEALKSKMKELQEELEERNKEMTWKMDFSSGEESDISDSEIFEYKEKPYGLLKSGKLKVKVHNGSLRCPFCAGKKKQDYKYKELLQHATGAGKGSSNRRAKQKANHLALAQYLENDLGDETEQPPQVAAPGAPDSNQNELLCNPWTGIVVNIVKGYDRGRDIFSEEEKLTGQAIVKFSNSWAGLTKAMEFEKSFQADDHSKKDRVSQKSLTEQLMFGWFARADDYESEGVIGDYLRKSAVLKTISDVLREEEYDKHNRIQTLTCELDKRMENLDELQTKYNEKSMSLSSRYIKIPQVNYNELSTSPETRRLQQISQENIRNVIAEQDLLNLELEAKRKELDLWSRELNRREVRTEHDRKKLDEERNKSNVRNSSLQLASMEQKRAGEKVLRLLEEQQREKEAAQNEILILERELDEKQRLEIERKVASYEASRK
ncbi:hypothetical protein POM88_024000 [Heracleum sosnowskyi]|uniref:fructose-bisphosphatase n=1 Tax=Heracleum sosnowskyi TaxID=360622 RepID=A0AAD8MR00_9APIA|nr:hypothetical protein POM88_024000 [Heracleum sosnowskyi]